jgi:hypothetical protein
VRFARPIVWQEMSTNRFKCYLNVLRQFLTTFDDFLTTNDDLRRWSLPGRNGIQRAVSFDVKGLSIVAAAQCGVIKKRTESRG